MTMGTRTRALMLGTVMGAAVIPASAFAQDAAQNDRLQRQIDALQQQLQSLQKQVAANKKTAAKAEQQAEAAGQIGPAGQRSAAEVSDGAYARAGSAKMPLKATFAPAGIRLGWGGYIEAAGIWRNRNEVADVGTDFNNIPYGFSPLNHENELRFSARQSRLFFTADGDISAWQTLRGYTEMDFLGAATTSNSIESNSYTPRLRHAFMEYNDKANGWTLLAGQTWSLLTASKDHIIARQEVKPDTIDAQYVVGFNWTRNPQIRLVKELGSAVTVGISAESPQVRFATPGSPTPLGVAIDVSNTGTQSGLMNTLQSYSVDQVPDIVEKVAFDPGFGHYEVVGLQRWFTDRVQHCDLATITCAYGSSTLSPNASNMTSFGWGVGGSMWVPVLPQFVDFQASVLYGNGIGRYGSAQLPDVTVAPNGSLSPVTALQTLIGAYFHVTPAVDVYAFAGLEKDNANYSSVTNGVVNQTGFGNPYYSDTLCSIEGSIPTPAAPASPVTGGLSNSVYPSNGCSVNVKQITELTVGFWDNLYKGPAGRLAAGAQFEYIHRDTFNGVGAGGVTVAPANNMAVVLASLRYYFP